MKTENCGVMFCLRGVHISAGQAHGSIDLGPQYDSICPMRIVGGPFICLLLYSPGNIFSSVFLSRRTPPTKCRRSEAASETTISLLIVLEMFSVHSEHDALLICRYEIIPISERCEIQVNLISLSLQILSEFRL